MKRADGRTREVVKSRTCTIIRDPVCGPVEEDRVVVLGEFGGLGMPVPGHTWQDQKNWGYVSYQSKEDLTDAYVALLDTMRYLIGKGLSAAVYTQTSDVEIEVNGLLTYDRELDKMEPARITAAAKRLYDPPPTLTTLAPTSEENGQEWRYTTTKPVPGWKDSSFDDSNWKTGPGGFGTKGTPGAIVGTEWDTNDIWLRSAFHLNSLPKEGNLYLRIHHDEDAQIYLNGKLLAECPKYVGAYALVLADKTALASLQIGDNTLAVHCRQTGGGQFIDVGLVLATD